MNSIRTFFDYISYTSIRHQKFYELGSYAPSNSTV
jgi:hypothetical protein